MIQVEGRALIIPKEERVIGHVADNKIETREFFITDARLFTFSFKLDVESAAGTDSIDLSKKQADGGIVLSWEIRRETMQKAGTLHAQLRAFSENGEEWHSAVSDFTVRKSIQAAKSFAEIVPTEFEEIERRVTLSKEAAEESATDAKREAEYVKEACETAVKASENAYSQSSAANAYSIQAAESALKAAEYMEEAKASAERAEDQGFSPTVKIEEITAGHRVNITDANGTQAFVVLDGVDGRDGENGVSMEHAWDGTVLTITSASGQTSADLKGEKGDRGERGLQGMQGERGADGAKGDKGERGEQGVQGEKGDPGYTPKRGIDYWTDEDKEEIGADTITFISTELAKRGQLKPEFANSLDECTDTTKLYVLPDGCIYAYMPKTEYIEAPNVYDRSAALLNYRYSGQNLVSANGYYTTDFIPVDMSLSDPIVLRFKGGKMWNGSGDKLLLFDKNKTFLGATYIYDNYASTSAVIHLAEPDGDDYIIKLGYTWTGTNAIAKNSNYDNIAYIRINQQINTSVISSVNDIPDVGITIDAMGGERTTTAWLNTGRYFGTEIIEIVSQEDEMTDTLKKYVLEETGTIWRHGETTVRPTFTNQIPISTDADGNVVGLIENYRYNSSDTLTVQYGTNATGFIPIKVGDTIRFENMQFRNETINNITAGTYYIRLYDSSYTLMLSANASNFSAQYGGHGYSYETDETGNLSKLVISDSHITESGYIRMAFIPTDEEALITVNEEIAYTSGGCVWYDTGIPYTGIGAEETILELENRVRANEVDIENLKNNHSSGTETTTEITIPTFWKDAVEECIAKIKALQVGRHCVTFPFFSDNHQRNGYAGALIAKVMDACHIPYCFYGGDSISSGYIDGEDAMSMQDKKFDDMMSIVPNGRFCRAVGNHDGYWNKTEAAGDEYHYTRAKVYELFLREESISQKKHFGDDGTYYYVDDVASKVRFVILNTNKQYDESNTTFGDSVDETQLSWLQNVALSFSESGWAVVFISHQPISNHYHAYISNADAVRTVVKNYIDGAAINKADVVGWFSGHIHRDRIYTGIATNTTDDTEGSDMGFAQVTITSDNTSIAYEDATKHTATEDNQSHAIDFVTINKSTRTVSLTRLGIGNDRSYVY